MKIFALGLWIGFSATLFAVGLWTHFDNVGWQGFFIIEVFGWLFGPLIVSQI